MPRFKLVLEYDGAPFVGWQRQANGLSVQQALEEAISPGGLHGFTIVSPADAARFQLVVLPQSGSAMRAALCCVR